MSKNLKLIKLAKVIKALISNIEVAQGGGKDVERQDVADMPSAYRSAGHVFSWIEARGLRPI